MQIRVIENNYWEGEKFSYVLDVTSEVAELIKTWMEKEDKYGDIWSIELNTNYTQEIMDLLNHHIDNGYKDYIGFYKIPEGSEIEEKLFCKGAGLNRILNPIK